MGVVIRKATVEDRPEWLRMRHLLWPKDDIEDLESEMDKILAGSRTPAFVAVRPDGKLGGFIEAGLRNYAEGCDTSPVGYLEGWFVDVDLRGQGIGGRLVKTAEDWARAQGMKEMGSDTWLDDEVSIKAHKALGYQETERLVTFAKHL